MFTLLLQIIKILVILLIGFALYFLLDYLSKLNHNDKKINFKKAKSKLKKVKANTTEDTGLIFGKSNDNIIKGKQLVFSSSNDEEHLLVIGGTGLGKTSALLIPSLKSWCNSKGTFIAWDISGDIHPQINAPNIIKYEPSNPLSTPYNIFGIIDKLNDTKDINKELAKLAILLMPSPANASEAAEYYNKEGRKIMTAALIAYYHQGLDFIEICEKINELSWKNLLNEIDSSNNNEAIRYINSFDGIPEQYSASAKQTCEDSISLFATDEDIKATIRRPKNNEIALDPTKLETHNIFIVMDDSDLELYSTLSQIIASQCLDFISKRPLNHTNPILLCLDEAASLGQIDLLPALRKFRKRHCRIFMLTQTITDIDLTWGTLERKSMLSNFRYKIVLECSEPEEQKYWSDLAGKQWVWRYSSNSHTNNHTSKTETLNYENRIEPHEFANLGNNLVLFYPGGVKILDKNYYFI